MFEKYTEKARRAIFFSRYEASQFGSPTIETEYLLLGFLREDKNLTLRLLRSIDAVQEIRMEIERSTEVREKIHTSVDLPLSNECKRILAFAKEESERLGHTNVDTGHLLLGLLREEKSFAAKLLHDRNVRLDQVRKLFAEPESGAQVLSQPAARSFASLTDFGVDLTRKAMNDVLPPLVGRERELQRIIQVLCRFKHRNPVLVGEPGIGKQTIVYGLAQRIAKGTVPELEGKSIVSLDLGVITSGTRSRTRFEENLETILRDLLHAEHRLILYIDGLHSLADTKRFLSVANVIKPALLDCSLQCVSTATPADYAKTVEASPWLERHFTMVEVKPPSEAEAIDVLMGAKKQLQEFHGVTYADDAIQYAVFHSRSYFPNRCLPEKALDLIDEAGARVKLRQSNLPAEIVELQKRIKHIFHRMENAVANHEFAMARFHSEEEATERNNLRELRKKHQLDESALSVTREDVEQIIAERTGLAIESLRKSKAAMADDEKK